MQDIQTLQRQHGSMFVVRAFLDTFNHKLAVHILGTIGSVDYPSSSHSVDAAFGMTSMLTVVHGVCGEARVADQESLEAMLETLHQQFGALDEDYEEVDRAWALQNLEHVFSIAADAARDALKEVQAGYPTSGGDFDVWKLEAPQRRRAKAG